MKTINEADFREIIKKDGVEGWNRWWKRNEKAIKPGSFPTIEELEASRRWAIDIDLNGADLSGRVLDGIILSYSDCRNANFINTTLKNAELVCVEFSHSNLAGADFSGSNLSFSIFENADLRGAIFDKTRLLGVDFENARLEGCDFSKAIDYCSLEEVIKGLGIDPNEITVKQITDDGKETDVSQDLFAHNSN